MFLENLPSKTYPTCESTLYILQSAEYLRTRGSQDTQSLRSLAKPNTSTTCRIYRFSYLTKINSLVTAPLPAQPAPT